MGFKGHLQWLEGCLGEEEIDLPVTIYMNMARSEIPAHRLGSDPRVTHPTPRLSLPHPPPFLPWWPAPSSYCCRSSY